MYDLKEDSLLKKTNILITLNIKINQFYLTMTFAQFYQLKEYITQHVSRDIFGIILKYTIPKCQKDGCNDLAYNYECCSLNCAFACQYWDYSKNKMCIRSQI